MNKVASLILDASAVTTPNTNTKKVESVLCGVVSVQTAVYIVGDDDIVST